MANKKSKQEENKIIPLNSLKGKDIKMFRALANCGYISKTDYHNYINPSRNYEEKLKTYIDNNIIKSVWNNKTQEYYYKFAGDKAKDYVRDLDIRKGNPINYFQNPTSIKHDKDIAEKYFSVTDKERDTWKNETELRNMFLDYIEELKFSGDTEQEKLENYNRAYEILEEYKNRNISTPDGYYVSETQIETVFEVVTDNYKEPEIVAKQEFCTIMKLEYTDNR